MINLLEYFIPYDDGNEYILEEKMDKLYHEVEQQNKELQQLKTENERLKKQKCDLDIRLKKHVNDVCKKYNICQKTYHEKIEVILNDYEITKKDLRTLGKLLKNIQHFCVQEQTNTGALVYKMIKENEV